MSNRDEKNDLTTAESEELAQDPDDGRAAEVGDEEIPETSMEGEFDDDGQGEEFEDEDYQEEGDDLPKGETQDSLDDSLPTEQEPSFDAARYEERMSRIEESMSNMIQALNNFAQVQHQARQQPIQPDYNFAPPEQLDSMDNAQLVNHALQKADHKIGGYLNQVRDDYTRQIRLQGNMFANILRSLCAVNPALKKELDYASQAANAWVRDPRSKWEDHVNAAKAAELQRENESLQKQLNKGLKANRRRAGKAKGQMRGRRPSAPVRVKQNLSQQEAIRQAMRELG